MTTWKASEWIDFMTRYLSKFGKLPEVTKETKIEILEALRRSYGLLYQNWKELPETVKLELLKTNKELELYDAANGGTNEKTRND